MLKPFISPQNFSLGKIERNCTRQFNLTERGHFFFDRIENFVGKGENAGYQHFLLFPKCFPKVSDTGSSKFVIMW